MSLYKRGGVYWSYIWINNIRHGRSLHTGSKQEAIRREIDFRNELDINRHKKSNINPEMRFATLATRFLGSSLAKPYHVDRLEQLLPYFGDSPLNEISKPLAEEYRRYRIRKAGVTMCCIERSFPSASFTRARNLWRSHCDRPTPPS